MEKGILHETMCPQTPHQNGVAERKNRHILEITRALLIGSYAHETHWADAITYAIYLMNRMPSRVLSFRTPLAVLAYHTLLFSALYLQPQVFGAVCVSWLALVPNKRAIDVIIHPLGIRTSPWMLPSQKTSFFFLIAVLLMGR